MNRRQRSALLRALDLGERPTHYERVGADILQILWQLRATVDAALDDGQLLELRFRQLRDLVVRLERQLAPHPQHSAGCFRDVVVVRQIADAAR